MSEHIQIDGVTVEVRRSARRRSVDLTVERDGEVSVAVPEEMSTAEIGRIVRGKQEWLYTALARKEATNKGPPPKEYVTGEGFFFLGRKYRLRVVADDEVGGGKGGLQWTNGRFFLGRGKVGDGKDLFVRWYTMQAAEWLAKRVNALKARVGVESVEIGVRDLGFRWGSCTHKGKVFFHWRTVLLPPERIDYLVLHELVHIHEHNHSAAFYERLRRASPDHKVHEAWFREHGDEYRL